MSCELSTRCTTFLYPRKVERGVREAVKKAGQSEARLGGSDSSRDARLLPRVLDQTIQSADAILPTDFLTLGIGTSPTTDADLIDAQLALGNLDGHFRLKAEPIFLQPD